MDLLLVIPALACGTAAWRVYNADNSAWGLALVWGIAAVICVAALVF